MANVLNEVLSLNAQESIRVPRFSPFLCLLNEVLSLNAQELHKKADRNILRRPQ